MNIKDIIILKKNFNESYKLNKTIFDYFHSLILKNNDFSQKLIEKIIKTKKIIIVSSYQLIPCAKYANDIFSEIGIEVLFSEIRIISDKIVANNIKNTPVLLLLAGQDNTFLVEFINFLNKDCKKENLFIISSESQSNKINLFNDKFVIYNNEKYINFKYRKICIDYILLTLQSMIV
ncbi:hypothetical protein [Spiroplasma taiwanense]|uniref:SIS domain-containing protein n=1 Tax=Spiroplasma taiwanense CT-1 TaxID=1276220 RepID=S5MHC4_9MOLU|nr:hypothetical protein [Spiroplasma taiwanense]AGR41245.1 hypothetical protein STAIW_v1c06260 [Spiroplasma taiwanense CT-1]